jgi:glutathione peroxidase
MKIIKKAKLPSQQALKEAGKSIYAIEINSLRGHPISLSDYKGQHILFVNVASQCGFTKQYKDLQTLSDIYKENLVVIGVPCNQFGGQEPGDAEQIQEFCTLNFGVNFPITEKIKVKGSEQHPLYQWLTSKTLNGNKSSSIKWNFQKYLIDENGNLIDYYLSITNPTSSKITKYLAK